MDAAAAGGWADPAVLAVRVGWAVRVVVEKACVAAATPDRRARMGLRVRPEAAVMPAAMAELSV